MSSTENLLNSILESESGLTLSELLTARASIAKRTAQRLIAKLITSGQVTALGDGRARRYLMSACPRLFWYAQAIWTSCSMRSLPLAIPAKAGHSTRAPDTRRPEKSIPDALR